MPNTAHIVETALLILAAYLVGCVIGYVVRRATQPRRLAEPATATAAAEAPPDAPLVTAPTIAPLPAARRRSAAERLAAAAGRSPVDEPAATSPSPTAAASQPAAESVIILPSPPAEPAPTPVPVPTSEATSDAAAPSAGSEPVVAPPVEPEPALAPVVAGDVPPIDEAAHVVEPAATSAVEAAVDTVDAPPDPETAAPAAEPVPAAAAFPAEPLIPDTRTALEDPEAAAMRAIEGNWTPRRASRSTPRPVPHPEQAAATVVGVDDAMETARSAVAAAAAAAAAAIAEAQERPRHSAAEGLSFDQRSEQLAKSFLADTSTSAGEFDRAAPVLESGSRAAGDEAAPADPASGLSFEPLRAPAHHGFGRPEALSEPRYGGPDNLKQIKGITPALEASLHGLGIFHFDQIADWDQKAVVWVDNHLSLRGRIGRDKWLEQARDLREGKGRTLRPVRR